MSIHIISVLGTGLYQPVNYDHEGKFKYVQSALIKKYQTDLSDPASRVTIFLTSDAKKRNWIDNIATERDAEQSSKWGEDALHVGDLKKGLHSEIKENFSDDIEEKLNTVAIPDGKNDTEIWQIFRALCDAIGEKDQIIFDITHSFRSIPMLAITALNYAKVTKDCTIRGIYYGAYEAGTVEDGQKQVPIFDLTIYNEILDWAHAASTLKEYGNPKELDDIIEQRFRNNLISDEEKAAWSNIRGHISAMCSLTETLSACRGLGADAAGKKSPQQYSIQAAYQNLKKHNLSPAAEEKKDSLLPLHDLLDKAEKSFDEYEFKEAQPYKIGMAAAKWCIDHDMTEQAYTALEETAKTFICDYYGLPDIDEMNRDRIAGGALNGIAHYMQKNMIRFQESVDRGKMLTEIQREYSKELADLTPEQKDAFDRIVRTVPLSYAIETARLKDLRNDINHFGIRNKPMNYQTLQTSAGEIYTDLLNEMTRMENAQSNSTKGEA